jgi:Spy/CpxP family protein refolding chaperone
MLKRLGMVSLAVLVMVAAAEAQPGQGGRGRGPGGFGRGGFGGFGGGGYMGLVRIEPVQTELKVTEEQKASIDKLVEEQRAAREQERGDRGGQDRPNFQDLSDEERAARMEEFRKQAAERETKSREQLAAILDDGQMQRLKQISIQLQGTQALSDEEVAKELALTDLQKEEIADTREEANREMFEQMRELFQPGQQDGDREANRAKMEELRKAADEKVLANLSDDQKQKFEAMKGPKFDMPAGAFGFGGGRFGQGGRRPGGDGAEGGGRRRPGGEGGNDGGNRPRRPDSV